MPACMNEIKVARPAPQLCMFIRHATIGRPFKTQGPPALVIAVAAELVALEP
jgi:hypothetical protein